MILKEIRDILGAEVLCCEEKIEQEQVECGFAADLMSDVLAFASNGALLITGLTNVQIIRTAQMMDIPAVLFVRGKRPQEETVALARQVGMPLLLASRTMFECCGKLFGAGLPAGLIASSRGRNGS